MRQMKPPVKKDQELTLKCVSIGKKGDGIFKHEKFVIIVPEANAIGKEYKIHVHTVYKSIAFGKIVEGPFDDTIQQAG